MILYKLIIFILYTANYLKLNITKSTFSKAKGIPSVYPHNTINNDDLEVFMRSVYVFPCITSIYWQH
jgi:hypothetical protein